MKAIQRIPGIIRCFPCVIPISVVLCCGAGVIYASDTDTRLGQAAVFRSGPISAPAYTPGPARDDDSNCDYRREYLASHLRAGRLDLRDLLARLVWRGFKVIYIGTSHNPWDTGTFAQVLDTLRKEHKSFDCLAIETDSRCQSAIDAVLSGRLTFEQAGENSPRICAYAFKPDQRPLFEAAGRNKVGVFAVDDLSVGFDQESVLPTQSVATTIPRRNEAMARATADLIRKGACRRVLGLAGAAHIAKDFYEDKEPALWNSIPDRLNLLGISAASVHLISRASYPDKGPFAPKDCSWNIWDSVTASGGVFGFIPGSPAPAAYYPLYPYGDPATLPYYTANPVTWDEFNGVIVVP